MKKKTYFHYLLAASIFLFACNKNDDGATETSLTNKELQTLILRDFSLVTAYPVYADMEAKMNAFHSACLQFESTQSQADLDAAKNAWKEVRGVWEKSEAFLFGPVSTENIDPGTDTWPVDFNSLDSLLLTSNAFTTSYIQTLGDELKGYHPAEYLLWGGSGNKINTQFTPREMEFLTALATDLKQKANQLRISWDPAHANNYGLEIIQAGNSTGLYTSQQAAFEEIVNAMIGICDEVANGKIYEPFSANDPSLEESPFSDNSITDFTNNIRGVQLVYSGFYLQNGYGIEDFIRKNNLSLHNKIVNDLNNAINSFNGITVPFGEAISTQPAQVQQVMYQINVLKTTLEDELLPFIQVTVED